MTSKEKFINFIEKEIFNHPDIYCENYPDDWEEICSYWKSFCSTKVKEKIEITENGVKVLRFMQGSELEEFKSKDIADGLGISSRSVAGTMRKLISEGFAEKIDFNSEGPLLYRLTDKGISKNLN